MPGDDANNDVHSGVYYTICRAAAAVVSVIRFSNLLPNVCLGLCSPAYIISMHSALSLIPVHRYAPCAQPRPNV